MKHAIFITGGARRIGLFIARNLLIDGYPVIVHYRTETKELAQLRERGVIAVQGDLSQEQAIYKLIERVRDNVSCLRAIIHNASAYEETLRNENVVAQYQLFFSVHMLAPYLINENLRELLDNSPSPDKDIIHITDINADKPNPLYDIYCSTKAGLANLNKSFAQRFAPGIKVNAIAPGPVLLSQRESAQERQRVIDNTPLRKIGGAEPVYLAVKSILANPFMTGSCVYVDGGISQKF